MKKILPLERWKTEGPPERESFSDEDSDEEDSDYEEIVISKKKQAKRKLTVERTKPQVRSASNQTQNGGKTSIAHPKEISAAGNTKQPSAKKAASGINRTARSTSWCASVKAVETEALIHPFSKIIREGTNCILL